MKIFFQNIAHGINPSKSYLSHYKWVKKIDSKWLDRYLKNLRKIKPDIVCLAEVDSGSVRSQSVNHARHFARMLDCEFSFYHKYEGTIARYLPIIRKHGAAVIYKKELNMETKPLYFSKGYKRLCIKAVLDSGSEKVSLYLLHLSLRKNIRKYQFSQLKKAVKKDKNRKKVIFGDFNLFGGAKELRKLVEGTDLKVHRNAEPTYPAWKPRVKLDWVIHSKDTKIKNFKVEKVLLSDHLALSFEI